MYFGKIFHETDKSLHLFIDKSSSENVSVNDTSTQSMKIKRPVANGTKKLLTSLSSTFCKLNVIVIFEIYWKRWVFLNAWIFHRQHICSVWWPRFSISDRNSNGNKLCSDTRWPITSLVRGWLYTWCDTKEGTSFNRMLWFLVSAIQMLGTLYIAWDKVY